MLIVFLYIIKSNTPLKLKRFFISLVFGDNRKFNKQDKVFFQIKHHGQGELTCYYKDERASSFSEFGSAASHFEGYAECGPWSKGNEKHKIKLHLNGKHYMTDENKALARGRHPLARTTLFL